MCFVFVRKKLNFQRKGDPKQEVSGGWLSGGTVIAVRVVSGTHQNPVFGPIKAADRTHDRKQEDHRHSDVVTENERGGNTQKTPWIAQNT